MYDASANAYGLFGNMSVARDYFSAVLLRDNNTIVVSGGRNSNSMFIFYLFDFNEFINHFFLFIFFFFFVTVTLKSAEYCFISNKTCSILSETMNFARYGHTANLVMNNEMLVCGGYSGSAYYDHCEIFNNGKFSNLNTTMKSRRGYHASVALSDGSKVYFSGGFDGSKHIPFFFSFFFLK